MLKCCKSRQFSHVKCALLLVVILNTTIPEPGAFFEQFFERDLQICPSCFDHQRAPCRRIFPELVFDGHDRFRNLMNMVLPSSGKRYQQVVGLMGDNKTRIVGKYLAKGVDFSRIQTPLTVVALRKRFADPQRLDGVQFCPMQTLQRVTDLLQLEANRTLPDRDQGSTLLSIWLHLVVNVQPLILPLLHRVDFPVPQTFATCGFTLFQMHAGDSLGHYYASDFSLRLRIAKQLLEAALRFTRGIDGFRFYITDLSADNIVYDAVLQKLTIVDLDTLYIVDGSSGNHMSTHRHSYIECDNCFAYAPEDLCAHRLSDTNLFAACQLLREDLQRNREKGFLHSVPTQISRRYPQLVQLLDECVDCVVPQCVDRFEATRNLIALFDKILVELF